MRCALTSQDEFFQVEVEEIEEFCDHTTEVEVDLSLPLGWRQGPDGARVILGFFGVCVDHHVTLTFGRAEAGSFPISSRKRKYSSWV